MHVPIGIVVDVGFDTIIESSASSGQCVAAVGNRADLTLSAKAVDQKYERRRLCRYAELRCGG